MNDRIEIEDLIIPITRKKIKNIHLSVNPPDGRVSISVPMSTRIDVLRAFVSSKLGWIRAKQIKIRSQLREEPRQFVSRESHYIWGKRYLLKVKEENVRPNVYMDHKFIYLTIRPNSDYAIRHSVMYKWHKELCSSFALELIPKWERKLNVSVSKLFLQKMKTKWGSCNPAARNIRLNTELVSKPKDLFEYVLVHEMAHLLVPNHGADFVRILDEFIPSWQDLKMELNSYPLSN